MKSQIDTNDLAFLTKRYGPIAKWACGLTKNGVIKPNTTMVQTVSGVVISLFHIKPVYYETIVGTWRPLSEVCTHHGNRKMYLKPDALKVMSPRFMKWLMARQRLLGSELAFDYGPMGAGVQPRHLLFATTSTFYPDPSVESTCVDGSAYQAYTLGNGETWATLVGALGSGGTDNGTTLSIFMRSDSTSNEFRELWRNFTLFDTSSIPDGDTISSAVLSLRGTGSADSDNFGLSTNVTACSPASNTAIVTGDYDAISNTDFATDVAWASLTPSGYSDWTFNATGIAAISKTGISKFVVRFSQDIDNSAPSWLNNGAQNYETFSADQTGTSTDPKLVVVHAVGGFVPSMATLGVGA